MGWRLRVGEEEGGRFGGSCGIAICLLLESGVVLLEGGCIGMGWRCIGWVCESALDASHKGNLCGIGKISNLPDV